jgi:hypothetical protein
MKQDRREPLFWYFVRILTPVLGSLVLWAIIIWLGFLALHSCSAVHRKTHTPHRMVMASVVDEAVDRG